MTRTDLLKEELSRRILVLDGAMGTVIQQYTLAEPVSDIGDWNWGGDDPNDWYPLDMRFTAVVVEKDAAFSGWGNYP